MVSLVPLSEGPYSRRRYRLGFVFLSLCFFLTACTTSSDSRRLVAELEPLELGQRQLNVADVDLRASTPDLLELDADMREFAQRYAGDIRFPRQRLVSLHQAIRGSATLGIRYDPEAGGTARDAFHRGSANCLSYASLFIALAREVGLDAQYQWLNVRPQWTRSGERVLVRLHVNVDVKVERAYRFMVDIDPLEPGNIAGSRRLSDEDAQALYHSNIAMRALASEDLESAWLHAVAALMLSPDMAHLWVNLGVVYRVAGQHGAAEQSYHYALQLDPGEHSAMNNLVILYEMDGRLAEQNYWREKVRGYRRDNPYYYAWLGEQASEAGQWREARGFYEKAVALSPVDSRLLFALSLAHRELGDQGQAREYLQQAIDSATLYSEIKRYQFELDTLQRNDDTRS